MPEVAARRTAPVTMKNFDDEMSKSGTRVPLKTSIIKWCKDTNQFAIYDYDPVDTLGDILPYQLR